MRVSGLGADAGRIFTGYSRFTGQTLSEEAAKSLLFHLLLPAGLGPSRYDRYRFGFAPYLSHRPLPARICLRAVTCGNAGLRRPFGWGV
jgi:hypothetical protein